MASGESRIRQVAELSISSAEGARIEAPKAPSGWGLGRGYPLHSRLGGLGERRKLPQQGPGQSPGRKRTFGTL